MLSEKSSYRKRVEALKDERSSFMSYWGELSDYHLAHRGRFLVSDRNKGYKRNTKQINNTSRRAVRTLASGMMAGITSPARPWFKLGLNDKKMMDVDEVKIWLLRVERVMREIFNQSNLYNSLHVVYQELGVFGTASMGVFNDFENVIRCKPYTVGSYVLALNGKDIVDTWAREYQYTVGQLVKKFGKESCSQSVQKQWDNGNTENWIDIVHIIEPNDDRDGMNTLAKHKRFRSIYYEKAKSQKGDNFLLKSGFDDFPILAPRWEVTGEDVYAPSCPGMDALGDTKALQTAELMKYEAIEKMVDPHLIAPASMRDALNNDLPSGEVSFVDTSNLDVLKPVYQVQPRIDYHIQDIEGVEDRIEKAFYVDLFLMLASSDRRQITAREIAERHEEKLLMLGPVLERLHNELLDPLIDRTFNIGMAAGIFGRVPDVLSEKQIKVEYISVLAQAQKLVEVGAIEKVAQYVGGLATIWPEARHKFDAVKSVENYADSVGVSPEMIKNETEFKETVAAEAAAQQQQQQMTEQGPAMAQSAKVLSETDTEGQNALTELMERAGV